MLCAANGLIPSGYTGWIAVSGASFIFGGSGIPMKSPSLLNIPPNPLIFALHVSVGIFLLTLPLVTYLLESKQFVFLPIAGLGSADIILINILAFQAVQILGYAKAPAIWCSVGMMTACLQGALVFHEPIHNKLFGCLSVPVLVIGVTLVLLCQQAEAHVPNKYVAAPALEPEEEDGIMKADEVRQFHALEIEGELPNKPLCQALLLCLLTGMLDGSLMVPFKLTASTTMMDTLIYLASFGICAGILSLMLVIGMHVMSSDRSQLAVQLATCLVPGVLTGMLWAAANFMSVHGTQYLGMKVGFPLTQTCVVFAAAWGILYFKEIQLRDWQGVCKLCGGVSLVIVGSVLLAKSN